MTITSPEKSRVLGICFSTRGVGFAVMESDRKLVNWGIKPIKSGEKNDRCISKAMDLIGLYKPTKVAVEDPKDSLRQSRITILITEFIQLISKTDVEVNLITSKQLASRNSTHQDKTKRELAEHFANLFPGELGARLPKKRRAWAAESYQMDIFTAVALADHGVNRTEQS